MCSIRLIKKKLWSYLFPPKCPGCGVLRPVSAADAFCPECREKWELQKSDICRRCNQPIRDCWCGIPNNKEQYVDAEHHLVQYQTYDPNIVNETVSVIKKYRNDSAFDTLADEIYKEIYLRHGYSDVVVTSTPRSRFAKLRYGHDQSAVLANKLCERTGDEYVDVLIHVGKTVQKTLTQKQRAKNAVKSYRIKNGSSQYLKGKTVILIDDVVTTGSTVLRCAHLLKMRGARKVVVFSIAKTI